MISVFRGSLVCHTCAEMFHEWWRWIFLLCYYEDVNEQIESFENFTEYAKSLWVMCHIMCHIAHPCKRTCWSNKAPNGQKTLWGQTQYLAHIKRTRKHFDFWLIWGAFINYIEYFSKYSTFITLPTHTLNPLPYLIYPPYPLISPQILPISPHILPIFPIPPISPYPPYS